MYQEERIVRRTMSNREKREGHAEHPDLCNTFNCPAVVVIVLSCCIVILLGIVSAIVCRKWKFKKKRKKTEQCMNTVEMEFQFLGNLYDSITSGTGELL